MGIVRLLHLLGHSLHTFVEVVHIWSTGSGLATFLLQFVKLVFGLVLIVVILVILVVLVVLALVLLLLLGGSLFLRFFLRFFLGDFNSLGLGQVSKTGPANGHTGN